MANSEMAARIKEQILAERNLWNQEAWAATTPDNVDENGDLIDMTCGTTGCVAGWACILSGNKIDWHNVETIGFNRIQAAYTKSGKSIEDVGAEVLDLDPEQAGALFHTFDDDMVLAMLDEIIGGEFNPDDVRWYE